MSTAEHWHGLVLALLVLVSLDDLVLSFGAFLQVGLVGCSFLMCCCLSFVFVSSFSSQTTALIKRMMIYGWLWNIVMLEIYLVSTLIGPVAK